VGAELARSAKPHPDPISVSPDHGTRPFNLSLQDEHEIGRERQGFGKLQASTADRYVLEVARDVGIAALNANRRQRGCAMARVSPTVDRVLECVQSHRVASAVCSIGGGFTEQTLRLR
jgi:hypothetical protein